MNEPLLIKELTQHYARAGEVTWLGVRSARKAPLEARQVIELDPERGLLGDHYAGRSGKRHLTLISAEHLAAVAGFLGTGPLEPGITRRNVVVSGLNLLALKGQEFELGEALLAFTDLCHPCSRMEQVLGPGGYNAMRGHGGICARVLRGGSVALGDELSVPSL
ncbi:MAG: MOSC domain-containing protein [Pseudomonadota bacterium]